MITITERAAAAIQDVLKSQGERGHEGVRITAEAACACSSRYSVSVEQVAAAADLVLELKGFKVFIDPPSQRLLEGAIIDFVNSKETDAAFTVHTSPTGHHQHTEGSCGCSSEGCTCGTGGCSCQH